LRQLAGDVGAQMHLCLIDHFTVGGGSYPRRLGASIDSHCGGLGIVGGFKTQLDGEWFTVHDPGTPSVEPDPGPSWCRRHQWFSCDGYNKDLHQVRLLSLDWSTKRSP